MIRCCYRIMSGSSLLAVACHVILNLSECDFAVAVMRAVEVQVETVVIGCGQAASTTVRPKRSRTC